LISMAALSILSISDNSHEATFDECMERTLEVCNLLQCEIIFCSPTEDLRKEITKALLFLNVSPTDVSTSSDPSKRGKFGLLFYSNILRPFLHTLLLASYDLVAFPFEKEVSDVVYVRNLLSKCLVNNAYACGNFPMREALNSDSMHNAIKFLRFKKIVVKQGMKLVNQELAERYIDLIHELLINVDGPLSKPQSQPLSDPRSQQEEGSIRDS